MRLWGSRKSSKDTSSSDSTPIAVINNTESNVDETTLRTEEDEKTVHINEDGRTVAVENGEEKAENEQNSKIVSPSTSGEMTLSFEQLQIHYLLKEYEAVAKNPIEGIYVTPGADSPLIWYGLLIVRSGVFYGGIFRFTLKLPDNFPNSESVPIVQFEELLFHPLVDAKTNCVDLSRYFPSGWQRNRNHIYQVVIATQGIFFSCHCDSTQAANPEAAILLKENRKKFIQMAHDAVRRSRTQVYAMPNSDDSNAIRFTPWDEAKMEPFRLYLLEKSVLPTNNQLTSGIRNNAGFSWTDEEKRQFLCNSLF